MYNRVHWTDEMTWIGFWIVIDEEKYEIKDMKFLKNKVLSPYRLMLGRLGQDDFVLPLISWTGIQRGLRQFDTMEVN